MYSGHRRPLKGNDTGAASQVVRNIQPKHHGGESLSARETVAPLHHDTDMDAFQKCFSLLSTDILFPMRAAMEGSVL